MAPTLAQARPVYRRLWDTMTIKPLARPAAEAMARKIVNGKARYQDVERQTGVPWWFIGLLHSRESGCNFSTYLGNGQPLNRRTTIVPKDRGPFPNFEVGAVDALKIQGFVGQDDWSLETVLYRQEAFNGWGYQGKTNSPYIWSGSNQYTSGKYVADHVYDPKAVDKQIGVAVILACMAALDRDVAAAIGKPISPPDVPPVAGKPTPKVPGKTTIATATVAAGAGATAKGMSLPSVVGIVIGVLIVAVIVSFAISKIRKDK